MSNQQCELNQTRVDDEMRDEVVMIMLVDVSLSAALSHVLMRVSGPFSTTQSLILAPGYKQQRPPRAPRSSE